MLIIQLKEISFHDLGKVPHICGGIQNLECYRYLPANDTWAVSGKMTFSHNWGSGVYHEELGLIISGDGNGGNGRTKVEHTLDGQTFEVLVSIYL